MKKDENDSGDWLRVCPNCGYNLKGTPHKYYPSRVRCPVCFYDGPAIEVRQEHYKEMRFAHEKMPERDEGKLVWPEILLMLVVSVAVVYLVWKLLRGGLGL